MKKLIMCLFAMVLVLCIIGRAQAVAFNEVGDTGELLSGVKAVGAGVDELSGRLNDDADLFVKDLSEGSFTAQVLSSTFDSQLFLVDIGGIGILENHDDGGTLVPSRLTTTLAEWDKLCWNYLKEIMFYSVWEVRYYLVTFSQIVGSTGTG